MPMTRQVGSPVSTDPVDCLVEIVEVAMNRMNDGSDLPFAKEAWTLGLITGIASRHSAVVARLKEIEEREELDG